MSTLKANNIQHLDATTDSIQVTRGGGTILTGVSTFSADVTVADAIQHTGNTGTAIRFPANDTFTVQTNSTEALRVTSTQRIGIGTASPDAILHTFGANTNFIKIETGDGGTNPIVMHENPDRVWHAGLRGDTNDSYVIRDQTAGTARLVIDTVGNIGIGTDNATGTGALTNNTVTLAVGVATVGALHVNGNGIPSDGSLSHRNVIDNGAARIFQRGNSFSNQTASFYVGDRWRVLQSGSYDISGFQSGSVPLNEFVGSFMVQNNVTVASPASTDFLTLSTGIERHNIGPFDFGIASAKQLTLSFWVNSTATGTYVAELVLNASTDQSVSATYTVNQASNWEYKTITFPANTATASNADFNGLGLTLNFWLAAGVNFTSGTLQTAWGNQGVDSRAPGLLTGFGGDSVTAFRITGIQLEAGSVATPFEHISVQDDATRCQRYYYRVTNGSHYMKACQGTVYSTAQMNTHYALPVQMRAGPTVTNVDGTATVSAAMLSSTYANIGSREFAPICISNSSPGYSTHNYGLNYDESNNSSTSLPTTVVAVRLDEGIAFTSEIV